MDYGSNQSNDMDFFQIDLRWWFCTGRNCPKLGQIFTRQSRSLPMRRTAHETGRAKYLEKKGEIQNKRKINLYSNEPPHGLDSITGLHFAIRDKTTIDV